MAVPNLPTVVDTAPGNGPLYGLDIETDTTVDGLDPTCAAVVAVAVAAAGADVVLTGPEPRLLRDLDDHLASLPAGVLVTWNGSGFDLPFLAERARRAGVGLALRLTPDATPVPARPDGSPGTRRWLGTWHGHDHLDGYRLYRADVGRQPGLSCGLKALARLVGLEVVELDRAHLHEVPDELLERYVASDARLARELVLRRWPTAAAWVDRVAVPVAEGATVPAD